MEAVDHYVTHVGCGIEITFQSSYIVEFVINNEVHYNSCYTNYSTTH